jgi:hypothetical protein
MLKWPLSCSVAAVLMASVGLATAQPVAQRAQPDGDFSAFTGTPDTLIRVIGHVEQTSGGHVLDVQFSPSADGPGYIAAVDQGGQVMFERLVGGERRVIPTVRNRSADLHAALASPRRC